MHVVPSLEASENGRESPVRPSRARPTWGEMADRRAFVPRPTSITNCRHVPCRSLYATAIRAPTNVPS